MINCKSHYGLKLTGVYTPLELDQSDGTILFTSLVGCDDIDDKFTNLVMIKHFDKDATDHEFFFYHTCYGNGKSNHYYKR